jgi:hypothetical protein
MIRTNTNNKWAARSGEMTNPFANLLKCARCGGALTRMSSRRDRNGTYTAYAPAMTNVYCYIGTFSVRSLILGY